MRERRESWWKEAGLSNSRQQNDGRSGFAARLAGALLPRACFLCVAPSGADFLCPACLDTLPRMPTECCPVCALPTPSASVCGACLKMPPRFDSTQAVFRYEFPIDQLVQSLKYAHRLASADFLGRTLVQRLPDRHFDMILPVPLASQRLAERGFNQALEIARHPARQMHLSLETRWVRRGVNTTPQAALPWKERAKNIRHAFECETDLTGKALLVIDDVMTTGATLNELAGALKACGAARVENLVLARTLKD
ncbi:MAG: ComF family protein [Rhodocyclales bacterium]|nr:ComF family protein [Rhodocyclales bacterium]